MVRKGFEEGCLSVRVFLVAPAPQKFQSKPPHPMMRTTRPERQPGQTLQCTISSNKTQSPVTSITQHNHQNVVIVPLKHVHPVSVPRKDKLRLDGGVVVAGASGD